MSGGRFARMRDIQDHQLAGRLSLFDCGVYWTIHAQADYERGLWIGSAERIRATAPRGCSLRDVQRSLLHLTSLGWIKPFRVRGQRGNYPVLIARYEPLSGAHKGMRLNIDKTTDWRNPVWESCAEDGTEKRAETVAEDVAEGDVETVAESDAEDAPIHRVLNNGNGKQKSSPRVSQDGFDWFWTIYPRKADKKRAHLAWGKIPAGFIPAILAGVEKAKCSEQWQKNGGRFVPLPSTYLNGRRWEDEIQATPQITAHTNESTIPILEVEP